MKQLLRHGKDIPEVQGHSRGGKEHGSSSSIFGTLAIRSPLAFQPLEGGQNEKLRNEPFVTRSTMALKTPLDPKHFYKVKLYRPPPPRPPPPDIIEPGPGKATGSSLGLCLQERRSGEAASQDSAPCGSGTCRQSGGGTGRLCKGFSLPHGAWQGPPSRKQHPHW